MTRNRRSPDAFVLLLLGLTLIAGFLRFRGLGDRDFWFDESCTHIYVHDLFDWPDGSSLLTESTNLPYYGLLRAWVWIFGESETAYRSLSALAATLVIPVLSLVTRRMAGPIAGIVCAAVVAFHPLHIYYAHEARAYALWTLALSIALALLVEAALRGRKRWWFAYGVAISGCMYLHYFTLYWLPASAVCVALVYIHTRSCEFGARPLPYGRGSDRSHPAHKTTYGHALAHRAKAATSAARHLLGGDTRRIARAWIVTHTVVVLAFVPYFLAAVLPAGRGGGSAWIAQSWHSLTAIPRTLWAFLPAGAYPLHLRGLSVLSPDTVQTQPAWLIVLARVLPACILAAAFLLSVLPVRRALSASVSRARFVPAHIFAGGLTLLPLILAWLYSVLVRPSYLVGRYDLVAWPACMVWVGVTVAGAVDRWSAPRARWVSMWICLILIGCSLVPIERMAALKPPPTLHHVRAERLAALTRPGDLVVSFSYDRDYLAYYLHRAGFAATVRSFPSWLDTQVGWVDTQSDVAEATAPDLARDAQGTCELLQAILDDGHRAWLIRDSMWRGQTDHARRQLNAVLYDALKRNDLILAVADETLGIAEIRRPSQR